jgi:DNA-binding PadR family transcriptional regulator
MSLHKGIKVTDKGKRYLKRIAELEKENARLKEDNRSGMNALKLSGQALSHALDDVEALLAENKRIVGVINET